jgi:hypothetical protein
VDAAEGAGEGVLLLGGGDEVDVIRHEAVAEDGDAVVAGVVFEELEVRGGRLRRGSMWFGGSYRVG